MAQGKSVKGYYTVTEAEKQFIEHLASIRPRKPIVFKNGYIAIIKKYADIVRIPAEMGRSNKSGDGSGTYDFIVSADDDKYRYSIAHWTEVIGGITIMVALGTFGAVIGQFIQTMF